MKLIPVWVWWAIIAALLVGLLGQRAQVSNAKAAEQRVRVDLANLKTEAAQAAQRAEKAARDEESRRNAEQEKIRHDAQTQVADAQRAARGAASDVDGLRKQLARYVAAGRAASSNPAVAVGSSPTSGPLDLLADLFGRSVGRAKELAEYADDARIAGQACQRAYDSLER